MSGVAPGADAYDDPNFKDSWTAQEKLDYLLAYAAAADQFNYVGVVCYIYWVCSVGFVGAICFVTPMEQLVP